MTTKTYSKVTTACVVAAIAAAVLFDNVPAARLWAGLLGITAALVAIGTYFRNWDSEDVADATSVAHHSEEPEGLQPVAEPEGLQSVAPSPEAEESKTATEPMPPTQGRMWEKKAGIAAEAVAAFVKANRHQVRYLELFLEAAQASNIARLANYSRYRLLRRELQVTHFAPSAAAVEDLVDKLFVKHGREYELVLHPDGRVVIRAGKAGQKEKEQERHAPVSAKHLYTVMRGSTRSGAL